MMSAMLPGSRRRRVQRLLISLASAIAALAPSAGSASTTTAGYITQFVVMNNGVVMFWHSGSRTTPPTFDTQGRFAINAATAAGQAQLSSLMTAYAAHKPVTIIGGGSCSIWGDTESIDCFYVQGG
jgi:hypothetical protein